MIRRPPRSTRTTHSFPTRRSSDLGPISPQDRWEENAGISPFTLGVEIAALVAAADGLPSKDQTYALSLADYWNDRPEDRLYTEAGAFTERFGVDGYYVRNATHGLPAGRSSEEHTSALQYLMRHPSAVFRSQTN